MYIHTYIAIYIQLSFPGLSVSVFFSTLWDGWVVVGKGFTTTQCMDGFYFIHLTIGRQIMSYMQYTCKWTDGT